jgi:hypothetical protein
VRPRDLQNPQAPRGDSGRETTTLTGPPGRPPAIDFQPGTTQAQLVGHQRIDTANTREAIEAAFRQSPVGIGRAPTHDHKEVVEVGRAQPVFHSRFNVTVHAILDLTGSCHTRQGDEDRYQQDFQTTNSHQH